MYNYSTLILDKDNYSTLILDKDMRLLMLLRCVDLHTNLSIYGYLAL